MSSTSSSDCENCDCCQCNGSESNSDAFYSGKSVRSRHAPFITAMGHPLIYYAQVPRPLNRRQNGGCTRKDNRNCFVKAFKWYTQERGPKPEMTPEISSFANWLDVKYIEYLRESQLNQLCRVTAQETTIINPCPKCPSPTETCTTKRFARIKSPWRKRRPCKDSGDVPTKCSYQSCEFIMQPKDLNRAASDCCLTTQTSGNKSNATVVSSNVPGKIKSVGKSYSLTTVVRETSIQKQIDIIPCTTQEGSKTKQPDKKKESRHEKMQQVPSKSYKVDVECQCPEEPVTSANAQTQYEIESTNYPEREPTCCKCLPAAGQPPPPSPAPSRSIQLSKHDMKPKLISPKSSFKKEKKTKVLQNQVSCQCPEENILRVDADSQYQSISPYLCDDDTHHNVICLCAPDRDIHRQSTTTVIMSDAKTCECLEQDEATDVKESKQVVCPKAEKRQCFPVNQLAICKCTVKQAPAPAPAPLPVPAPAPVKVSRSMTGSCTCVAHDGAQTSDHSICLDNVKRPHLLKIVCANRLNN